ncbi:DNA polymerase III subunit alpha, partial [bacterium]|nr:DNA polymerase III subunit alpha [bacterium]
YSFCKPHSASYALVSFKSAYLRAHYPAEFMAAVISNEGGYYSTRAYLSEAERMGLTIQPLDINYSEKNYQGNLKNLRVGFMQLKGIRNNSIHRILAARKSGYFISFTDFLRRVRIEPSEVGLLIKAGAMDRLEPNANRPALVWRLKKGEEEGKNSKQRGNELDLETDVRLPKIRDYPASLKRRHENEVFGCMITHHPLTLYADKIMAIKHTPGCELAANVGRKITMIGWMVAGKVVSTKNSKLMEFYSFEDQTALYETTFFPRVYARFCQMITDNRPYILHGRVEENYGVATLNVEKVHYL